MAITEEDELENRLEKQITTDLEQVEIFFSKVRKPNLCTVIKINKLATKIIWLSIKKQWLQETSSWWI